MLPTIHFLASIVVVGFLFPFYSWWSFAFLIGGFLVDVDHYLWYILKKRKLSLRRAYLYHRAKIDLDKLHIFHVWEFWLLMVILAFWNGFFTLVALGLFFHLIMDMVDLSFKIEHIHDRAFSFFMWLKRN